MSGEASVSAENTTENTPANGRTRETLRGCSPKVDITLRHSRLEVRWASAITEESWSIYSDAMHLFRKAGVDFMLGGGFALATFTGRWRDTKDIDFYIHPQDRPKVVQALTEAGYTDYFDRLPYDRNWIYRAVHGDTIVDSIWAMANQRAQVDDLWFERSEAILLRGEELRVMPIEEFIWCKLYILQRDHCDWTDIFNVIYVSGPYIDWGYLMERLGEDLPLLRAMLSVYGWFSPRASQLPCELYDHLEIPRPVPVSEEVSRQRMRFLDGRAWFAASMPRGEKLEV